MTLGKQRGFTLVELMIVVAIVGVLAALAVYGVQRYLAYTKATEARNALGQMGKDASTAYQRESMAGQVLGFGSVAGASANLCTSASKSVPAAIVSVKGQKYQSSPAEWVVDQATQGKGFACLKFAMNDPQYYVYSYTSTGGGAVGASFTAKAQGDIDGDATDFSEFTLSGDIQNDTSGGLVLTIAPNIQETLPEE